jgi:perosamine synthetase
MHALADRHGLLVIEDAACALGARRDGRRCGGWPGATCFSFHPRKVPTTGEGGMITTDDATLAGRIDLLRNHGGAPAKVGFVFVEHGYNYRLSEIPAALGIAQMKRLDATIGDRRRAALVYSEMIAGIDGVTMPLSARPEDCTFQSLVVLLDDAIDRDAVVRGLRDAEIESTLGTYAMHLHPAFGGLGYRPGDLANAAHAERQSLTLPLLPNMDEATVGQVVAALIAATKAARRR